MSAKGRALTKAEAVEVLFHIYVPKGTKMKLADVRKSTWLNPLDDGRDIMQLLSKKDLEQTNLLRCLEVVAGAGKESDDIQDLLRPEFFPLNHPCFLFLPFHHCLHRALQFQSLNVY